MSKLKLLAKTYTIRKEDGWSSQAAAEESVQEILNEGHITPYIYKDIDHDPSHVFYKGEVYFFGGEIYAKNKKQDTELDRAIQIVGLEIEKRKSKISNQKNSLRVNELKVEIESLEKALLVIKNDSNEG